MAVQHERDDAPRATTTTAARPATTGAPGAPLLTYEVIGSGTASVTYFAGDDIAQREVALPWRVDVPGGASFASISGQIDGTGDVTCKIWRRGTLVSETTSSGAYVIASCTD